LISDYIVINRANIWERIWYATGQMKGIDMIRPLKDFDINEQWGKNQRISFNSKTGEYAVHNYEKGKVIYWGIFVLKGN